MKFSVLLPTRNRLDLLCYAVTSVLRQDYDDWEIIISDNCSEDDVQGYVESLNDLRVKYYRTAEFLSVTDNWNYALDRSSGDYVIMLGDDDALMPRYFSRISGLIETYDQPDFIYTDAYLFAYPGVLPAYPSGYLSPTSNSLFKSKEPFLLDRTVAVEIVQKSLAFQLAVLFNMQFSIISRTLIQHLANRGPFYQSLFPDYYATVAAFLLSERIVIYQQPLVVVGISPKSHGFYYYNKRMQEAQSMLHKGSLQSELAPIQSIVIPGDWIHVGWLSAMYRFATNYADVLEPFGLGFEASVYRRKVILQSIRAYYRDKTISEDEYNEIKGSLRLDERLFYSIRLGLYYRLAQMLSPQQRMFIVNFMRQLIGKKRPPTPPPTETHPVAQLEGFQNILDVFERMPEVVLKELE